MPYLTALSKFRDELRNEAKLNKRKNENFYFGIELNIKKLLIFSRNFNLEFM